MCHSQDGGCQGYRDDQITHGSCGLNDVVEVVVPELHMGAAGEGFPGPLPKHIKNGLLHFRCIPAVF